MISIHGANNSGPHSAKVTASSLQVSFWERTIAFIFIDVDRIAPHELAVRRRKSDRSALWASSTFAYLYGPHAAFGGLITVTPREADKVKVGASAQELSANDVATSRTKLLINGPR